MTDRRWSRLLRWVRERQRENANYAKNNHGATATMFHAQKAAHAAETFKAVIIVMEAETRKWRKESRRKHSRGSHA